MNDATRKVTTKEAAKTVVGVVSARQRGSVQDAELIINGYMQDSISRGHSLGEAWALLFATSAVWCTDLVDALAAKNDQSGQAQLADLALGLAATEWQQ